MNAPAKVGIGTPLSRVDGTDKVTGAAKAKIEAAGGTATELKPSAEA